MFIKQSSIFDKDLVSDFERILKTAQDESLSDEEKEGLKEVAGDETEDKPDMEKCDKFMKAVELLSQVCDLLEDCDECDKVCKKVNKAIKLIGDICDDEKCAKTITESDEVEESVEEKIEDDSDE